MVRGASSWYERRILPSLIGCACTTKPIMRRRTAVVPLAEGTVLELGIGSGANLRFYDPAKVEGVWGVDPSAELRARAREAPRAPGLKLKVEAGTAEALPYNAGRFDTVVCTFTLCSVEDPAQALSEARRVTKRGGRLLFCEHGLAPERRVARFQAQVEPVWSKLAGGCRLTRSPADAIAAAGWKLDRLDRRYLRKVPKFVGYVSEGVAV